MDSNKKVQMEIDRINKVVCEYFNVDVNSLYGKDRTSKATTARGFAIYILHKNGISINRLSVEYNRVPRAVCWHCAKLRDFIRCYPDYREKYDAICRILK